MDPLIKLLKEEIDTGFPTHHTTKLTPHYTVEDGTKPKTLEVMYQKNPVNSNPRKVCISVNKANPDEFRVEIIMNEGIYQGRERQPIADLAKAYQNERYHYLMEHHAKIERSPELSYDILWMPLFAEFQRQYMVNMAIRGYVVIPRADIEKDSSEIAKLLLDILSGQEHPNMHDVYRELVEKCSCSDHWHAYS